MNGNAIPKMIMKFTKISVKDMLGLVVLFESFKIRFLMYKITGLYTADERHGRTKPLC